jgi:branched-chain amino acid transport system ATP-binding protein
MRKAGLMLEIKGIEKSFGGLKAVNNCSLEVKEGTITGLIGPNGAGKTTLFNIITGHYKPDSGKIFFRGEPIQGLEPHQIFKKRVYRTFQITREFAQMTVLENLMIMPEHQSGEKIWNTWFRASAVRNQEKEIRDKALEVLEFVELINLKDEYAGSLSGGQKKLLEIARSMMADPRLVLLDEPGAGVNPSLMQKLITNIRTLRDEKGITFFLVEHDMELVMNLCEPIIVMSEGTKLCEGTAAEVQQDECVLEAYLGGQYR